MPPRFSASEEESALVAELFARGEPHKLGVLTGEVALDLFSRTNLSVQVLSDIWNIADKDGHGWLSPKQTAAAVRLIGWAQVGVKATPELLEKAGPLAHIPDVPGPSKISSSVLPPFDKADKVKFQKLFLSSDPVNGLVNGDKAREIFSKSKLPAEKLSQIWELSDTENRGALDSTDFAIAMHLIQGLMNNIFSVLPASLPSGLYEQAAAEPPSPSVTTPSSPSAVLSSSTHLSVHTDLTPLNSQSRSPTSSRHSDEQIKSPSWDIPSDVKAISDRQFDALDPLKNGFIHDNISLPFLLESKLPSEELARIWTLADVNGDGKLTRDGFAIALFLIDERRRGNSIQTSLPSLLKPDTPHTPPKRRDGKEPQSLYSPEKTAHYQLLPRETVQRRASRVIYPPIPPQPNLRFSSVWTPGTGADSGSLAPSVLPPDTAISDLTRQNQKMQTQIAQLRLSHIEKTTVLTNLTQENVSLRVLVEELQLQVATDDPESQKLVNQVLAKENEGLRATMQQTQESLRQLQASSSDVELQRIQYEDLVRENERLGKQVTEMRESTTQLPWSGGDSELQTLINEDLARENARLRSEAREMQENVAQLQEATSGYEEQRRVNAELVRDHERLQTTTRAMQTRFDQQRRELRQLSRELERLKGQIRTNAQASAAGPSGSHDADIPPPAYDEVDPTLT
ncbi:hypothetical protein C8R43DRAFT_947075 [Mycena crocata]|nr:hypothetical protein C8R43DRAFT_947075 [Mycena crocata]